MPRITIDYDSDSSFERDHLRLATHHQILTQYLSGKNDKKQPPKEKVVRLEHGSEKAFLALKRVYHFRFLLCIALPDNNEARIDSVRQ